MEKLTKMQPLLTEELAAKRKEAAQAQRFTNALSSESTVKYNKAGFNNVAVLLQVLNHEKTSKDAKAHQAGMTMPDNLPDDEIDPMHAKVHKAIS